MEAGSSEDATSESMIVTQVKVSCTRYECNGGQPVSGTAAIGECAGTSSGCTPGNLFHALLCWSDL